jgi:hypothetical protein
MSSHSATLAHNIQSWADYQADQAIIDNRQNDVVPVMASDSWSCEFCDDDQHKDQEPMYSAYYSRRTKNGVEGPKFCSHNCLCNWKSVNISQVYTDRVATFSN